MAKFECWIATAYSYHGTVIVEAESLEQAKEIAWAEIDNVELHMGERLDDLDEVTNIVELEG